MTQELLFKLLHHRYCFTQEAIINDNLIIPFFHQDVTGLIVDHHEQPFKPDR